MSLDKIGNWPISGKEARKQGDLINIPHQKMLHTIHGETHPIPFTLYVSNDLVHMGEFSMPSGGVGPRVSDPLTHRGDAIFYVESGPVTFFLPDTHDTFEVHEGEAMIIPEGTTYQCVNYANKTIKTIFSISPLL